MGLLRFFNVLDLKALVTHENSQDRYSLPYFFQGESPDIEFMALQRDAAGTLLAPYLKVDPDSYSLKIGLFATSGGAQLAFQDTFTNDSSARTKLGRLVYDSAAITTALAGGTQVACTFEIEMTTGASSPFKSFQADVILRKQFITPGAVTTPAGEVTATQAWVNQTCVPRDGTNPTNPCKQFYMLTPGGRIVRIYPDDDGVLQREVL